VLGDGVPEVLVLPEAGPRWVDGLAQAVERAGEVLLAGGCVVLPTDTVYGVAALAAIPGAAARLFAAKERAEDHPLAVLVAGVDQALPLVASPSAEARQAMARHWPGPLTLVLRRAPEAEAMDLGGDVGTIGVRCPDHAFVRALAARVGPIATTSANRTGEPTPRTAQGATASLAVPPDLVVDGGPAGLVASTVVDASSQPWRILRVGALSETDLVSDS
jgi:L-threonylcarbamoyladenylate synthase